MQVTFIPVGAVNVGVLWKIIVLSWRMSFLLVSSIIWSTPSNAAFTFVGIPTTKTTSKITTTRTTTTRIGMMMSKLSNDDDEEINDSDNYNTNDNINKNSNKNIHNSLYSNEDTNVNKQQEWRIPTKVTSTSTSIRNSNTRRDWIVQTGEITLGSFLVQLLLSSDATPNLPFDTIASAASTDAHATVTTGATATATATSRTVVITGANSGIGLEACMRLALLPDTTIVLACRTYEKAVRAIEQIIDVCCTSSTSSSSSSSRNEQQTPSVLRARLIPAECDLSNIQSIQSFVTNLIQQQPKSTTTTTTATATNKIRTIDVLALNAGIARNVNTNECLRTKDGFELTIGINHFGHFYLNTLLLPYITGSIVVTASSVHDPNSPGGSQGEVATLGTMDGLENYGILCEMIDGKPFNADKAYKDSKLCNVLFTRELQRRLDNKGLPIVANCFTPGLIVSTGLFRDQNPFFTKLFDVAATKLFKVGETPQYGGAALTYMINNVTSTSLSTTTTTTTGARGGQYYYSEPGSSAKYGESAFGNLNAFGPTQVSIEAQDDAKAKRLWELSEKLLNIKTII